MIFTIIFSDSGNSSFTNAAAKPALVSQLLELITSISAPPRQHLPTQCVTAITAAQHADLLKCELPQLPVLQPNIVAKDRLNSDLRHFNRYYPVLGRCPLHTTERRRTHWHCTHCGVPLHQGLCYEIFHSVYHLAGIDIPLNG